MHSIFPYKSPISEESSQTLMEIVISDTMKPFTYNDILKYINLQECSSSAQTLHFCIMWFLPILVSCYFCKNHESKWQLQSDSVSPKGRQPGGTKLSKKVTLHHDPEI